MPGLAVFGMRSLAQVRAELKGELVPEAAPVAPMSGSRLVAWRGSSRLDEHDLADLDGVPDVKYALEVAAAGGHHLLLTGPKGSGKTSLAERLPGILPDLTAEEALELTAIHSLAGALEPGDDLLVRPPYFAPHHDASKASLLGGGTGRVRPGEISRAHCGVLFLDEFPLFRSDVIEALRQPLESGEVTIARGEESATYPARSMVVMACNPCPCGGYQGGLGQNDCSCGEVTRRHYQRRVTGPVHDRIDIVRQVLPPAGADAADAADGIFPRERSARGASAGRAGPPAPARTLHRARLAPQLPGAERSAPRRVATARGRPAPSRRRSLPGAAEPTGCRPCPPARLDRRRRPRGRVARRGRRRHGAPPPQWRRLGRAGPEAGVMSEREEVVRATAAAEAASEEDRLARVALGRLTEPGDPRIARLVAALGAPEVLSALSGPDQRSDVARELATRLRAIDPGGDLERAGRRGLRFVVPGDAEWPTQLDDLVRARARRRARRSTAGALGEGPGAPRRAVQVGRGRRVTLGDDLRQRGRGRHRGRPGPGRPPGGLRGGVRHRPGGPPRRTRGRRRQRRGPRLRGRPRLSDRSSGPPRAPGRDRARRGGGPARAARRPVAGS